MVIPKTAVKGAAGPVCHDLTHPITPDMPVYPGTEPPRVSLACTIEADGFNERRLTMYSHTGTHMDSPSHILAGGVPLDRLPVESFYGPATVLDVSGVRGPVIPAAAVNPPQVGHTGFILLYTGWCHKWGQPGYFSGFPVLSPEAALLLAGSGLKGIGTDTISVDPVGSTDFTIHKIFLSRGIPIIENLTNLQPLVGKRCTLYCFPLKIKEADGSPVRAVAVLDRD